MKKIVVIAFSVLMLAGLAACGKKQPPAQSSQPEASVESSIPQAPDTTTPTSTVALFMDAVKELDTDGMRSYVTVAASDNVLIGKNANFTVTSAEDEKGMELAKQFTGSITYTIKSESINGDQAVVTAAITAPDLSNTISKLIAAATKFAAGQALSGKSVDMDAFMKEFLANEVDFSKQTLITTDADIILVKQSDGTWLVDNDMEVNVQLANALTGGILDQVTSMVDLAKKFK